LALLAALGVVAAPAMAPAEPAAAQLIARLMAPQPIPPAPKPAPRRAPPAMAGAAPLPALPAERYYPAHELDERPLILNQVEPYFPAEAGNASGRVRLELLIGAHGGVDAVNVLGAQPPGLFESAAKEAFAEARFRPGMRAGVAVKSALTLELLFGEPLPPDPRLSAQKERPRPENPNAVDAPDRAGIKHRQRLPKEPS
jgi:TonB family protein